MGSENRLNCQFCQELIRAFNAVRDALGPNSEGAVITRGKDAKFFCTDLDLHECERNPYANADGFYPLLRTILDCDFPTVALLTGHTFGGACPLAFAHDYRVMNSKRGFISMPPVDLGMYFSGVGVLPRVKLHPQVARKVLLEGVVIYYTHRNLFLSTELPVLIGNQSGEGNRFTGEEALADGLVDDIADPENIAGVALDMANRWAPKAKAGIYGLLRSELWGEMSRNVQQISYVHSRSTYLPGKPKI